MGRAADLRARLRAAVSGESVIDTDEQVEFVAAEVERARGEAKKRRRARKRIERMAQRVVKDIPRD